MSVELLEREMYSEAEAARLLGASQATLHYWLEGGERRGRTYRPVVRVEPRGGRAPVTWAEFVEAGLLRSYRRSQVPMRELREFIDRLRERYGVPYPLAHEPPYVSGRELVFRDQEAAGVDPEFALVTALRGQYLLAPVADEFYRRVSWADELPVAWRPSADPSSPVRIDPDVRFGRPAIRGVSTRVIVEHLRAGESDDEVAEAFDLDPDDVAWARTYELAAA